MLVILQAFISLLWENEEQGFGLDEIKKGSLMLFCIHRASVYWIKLVGFAGSVLII